MSDAQKFRDSFSYNIMKGRDGTGGGTAKEEGSGIQPIIIKLVTYTSRGNEEQIRN